MLTPLCADYPAAAPYSKLSKAFSRKWLAGYAYDASSDRVRLYLSTLKPKAPQLPAGGLVTDNAGVRGAACERVCTSAVAEYHVGP